VWDISTAEGIAVIQRDLQQISVKHKEAGVPCQGVFRLP